MNRLSRYCDGLIEMTWLLTVIFVPLYFFLEIDKPFGLGKTILQNFLNTPDQNYETYINEPLRSLALEIKQEKIKAQGLLTTIAEEEQ